MEKLIEIFMKNIYLKIMLFNILLSSTWAYEYQVKNVRCFKKPLHIHYINGVNTNNDESAEARAKISDLFEEVKYRNKVNGVDVLAIDLLHNESRAKQQQVSFSHTNNRTHLFGALDVLESAIQRSNLKIARREILDEIEARIILDGNLATLARNIKLESTTQDTVATIVESLAQVKSKYFFFLADSFRKEDLNKLYNKIAPRLNDEQQVIVVAHSQGNLFANELSLALFQPGYEGHGDLDEDKASRFGIMHLASPFGSSFHSNSESILVEQDIVINTLVGQLDSGISANYVLSSQWNTEKKYSRKVYAPRGLSRHLEVTETYYSKDIESYPRFGHSVMDVYLSNDINVSNIGENDFSISMVDLFHDKMNTIASRFPASCEPVIEKEDSEFVELLSSIKNNDSHIYSAQFKITTDSLGIGFHVPEDEDSSPYIAGDLKSINLNIGYGDYLLTWDDEVRSFNIIRGQQSAGETSLENTVINEDIYPILNPLDENFSHDRGVVVKAILTDKYDQKNTFEKFVSLCSGEECCTDNELYSESERSCIVCPTGSLNSDSTCNYPEPSAPQITITGQYAPEETTCDGSGVGSYTIGYSRCSYEIACDQYSTPLGGISSGTVGGARTFSCEYHDGSWGVVERITGGGSVSSKCINPEGEESSSTTIVCF